MIGYVADLDAANRFALAFPAIPEWDQASDDQKTSSLELAYDLLNGLNWDGEQVDAQVQGEVAWPRNIHGVVNMAVPNGVIRAQVLWAMLLRFNGIASLSGGSSGQHATLVSGAVTSITAGDTTIRKSAGGKIERIEGPAPASGAPLGVHELVDAWLHADVTTPPTPGAQDVAASTDFGQAGGATPPGSDVIDVVDLNTGQTFQFGLL